MNSWFLGSQGFKCANDSDSCICVLVKISASKDVAFEFPFLIRRGSLLFLIRIIWDVEFGMVFLSLIIFWGFDLKLV